ncbi:hypothetical protein OSJ94_06865 [Levilactobacillus brevis]|uniref:hypothetical protein n=1 Tax=Levilactobacillus brevis TaxID=1580 RepID=UPI00225E6E53|nr:hypothetical protein [Levilactobacillus brevis]MCX7510919.1 hypothetical protein [Levilactobacillus brevis]
MKIIDERNSYRSKENKLYITNILSPSDILIRGGKDYQVDKGMYFDILDEPTKIIDPNTKKILGTIFRYKYRMQVIEAWQNISRLTTTSKSNANFSGTLAAASLSSLNKREKMHIVQGQHVDDVFTKFSHNAIKIGDILVPDSNLDLGIKYYPNLK